MRSLEQEAFLMEINRLGLKKVYLSQDFEGKKEIRNRIEDTFNYKLLLLKLSWKDFIKKLRKICYS